MRRVQGFVAGVIAAAALFWLAGAQGCGCLNGTAYAVFSPNADADLISFLQSAQESVDVEVYQFSNPLLKAELVDAVQRGVRVRLIMEARVESNYETASFLSGKGVLVKWGSLEYSNTHAKYCVVDAAKVFVGSTNWSNRAMESNREAAVVIEDEGVAAEFAAAFNEDWVKGVAAG